MGEHKFKVGDRVCDTYRSRDEDGGIGTVEAVGDSGSVDVRFGTAPHAVTFTPAAHRYLTLLPADPPSVGVPGRLAGVRIKGNVVSDSPELASQREGLASYHAQYNAQQQMAAQQQGHGAGLAAAQAIGGDWVSGKEHAALKAERDKLLATATSQSSLLTGLRMERGDLCGIRDELRAKVADLETQVAYLTRELVLAKARARRP